MTTTAYIITTAPQGHGETIALHLHGDEAAARVALDAWAEDASAGDLIRLRRAAEIDPALQARAKSLTGRHASDPEAATVCLLIHWQALSGREITRVDWRI